MSISTANGSLAEPGCTAGKNDENEESYCVAETVLSEASAADLFQQGDYATVAMKGSKKDWRHFAALGLIGKTEEALAGLEGASHPEAVFYSAVAHWIGGDAEQAAALLESVSMPHAQRLLGLIRKPRIEVLAQLPWLTGLSPDLLTGMRLDPAFHVRTMDFQDARLPLQPYADIHAYYDPLAPPDFYICSMVEWHPIPPALQQLPCPVFGQTGDYDLHIQAVLPWLKLFDEIVVTDPSEWREVRLLTRGRVSTFPKSFRVPDGLPPCPETPREVDFYFSGTILHPYHPDKARLLHRVISLPDLRLNIVSGLNQVGPHYRNLGNAKTCLSYVRHPTALPTRGLEALAMGCALIVQQDSVLCLFLGENEGVVSYATEDELIAGLRRILAQWPVFEQCARRGAKKVRADFASPLVASQYLRFLTFLAAKPRPPRRMQPVDSLFQKRAIVEKGWLPCRRFRSSAILRRIGASNQTRLQAAIDRGPASSRLLIDLARESVLFNFHRAQRRRFPLGEWLSYLTEVYRRGLIQFPRSLVLRFNFIRSMCHFGNPESVSESLEMLAETLAYPIGYWTVDPMEDVFPWDFFPQYFNYRCYFDLVTRHYTDGADVDSALVRLIVASLHFYRGFYAPYGGFHEGGLEDFRRASALDPEFPFYKLNYAKRLLKRGLPEDFTAAFPILTGLADGSVQFLEAAELLDRLYGLSKKSGAGQSQETPPGRALTNAGTTPLSGGPPAMPAELERLVAIAARARGSFLFVEKIEMAGLRPDLLHVRKRVCRRGVRLRQLEAWIRELSSNLEKAQKDAGLLRLAIGDIQTSKLWKIHQLWLGLKRMVRLGGSRR